MARVVVLGGYGAFGARLARRLVADGNIDVMVAGRSLEKARAHCDSFGGVPLALDRDADLTRAFADLRPDIVIDCAGPFQADASAQDPSHSSCGDRYRVARAAIACGAHYVDLADDVDFVVGIGCLDSEALAAGVCVISGASSVPAISSAALDELTRGMTRVASVSSAILPGNRAPRGMSVMRAILSQAGQRLKVWRGGQWSSERGWGDLHAVTVHIPGTAPLTRRLSSRIGAPDLALFPERYGARSVEFRAGLELRTMHIGLWALTCLVRLRLVRNLVIFTRPLQKIAGWLERLGSDRGAMVASASGVDADGRFTTRVWQLVAEGGDGPEIPATPALLICRKLLAEKSGETAMKRGARPAVGVLTLAEVEAGFAPFAIKCGVSRDDIAPLLLDALGGHASGLPQAWRRLAEIGDCDWFAGEASVSRGGNHLSRLAGFLFRFPPASDAVAVHVTKERTRNGERWTRRFDGKPFVSHLSRQTGDPPGMIHERFGPFKFRIDLRVDDQRVEWPVTGWRALGIPLPLALAPRSETFEFVDDSGRFRFDVAISLPLAGLVVRYRGWLEPVDESGKRSQQTSTSAA